MLLYKTKDLVFEDFLDKRDGNYVYICPKCVKKYGLYSEVEYDEATIQALIDEKFGEELYCDIEGCDNNNALLAILQNKDCMKWEQ
jgi:hypothetical protein